MNRMLRLVLSRWSLSLVGTALLMATVNCRFVVLLPGKLDGGSPFEACVGQLAFPAILHGPTHQARDSLAHGSIFYQRLKANYAARYFANGSK